MIIRLLFGLATAAGIALVTLGPAGRAASEPPEGAVSPLVMTSRVLVPQVVRSLSRAAPPVAARISALEVPSAGVHAGMAVESRGTITVDGSEYFDQPSHPSRIAWYSDYGRPGIAGSNSLLSAHVNYFGFEAATPFARLHDVKPGDDLFLLLDDGRRVRFTVLRSEIFTETALAQIWFDVVYPRLGAGRERVTLLTCAGNFLPSYPGGPGVYDSRLIVTAERIID